VDAKALSRFGQQVRQSPEEFKAYRGGSTQKNAACGVVLPVAQ
jgi:hypothetical protein